MRQFFTKSLTRQLITQFLLAALIPIALLSFITFYYSKAALKKETFGHLSAESENKKNQAIAYFKNQFNNIRILAESPGTKNAFNLLQAYHDAGGGDTNGSFDVNSKEYKLIYEEIAPLLNRYSTIYGYHDLFFVCKNHGHVMYTTNNEDDLGSNLRIGPYKDSALALLREKIIKDKKITMTDLTYYKPNEPPTLFIGAPVYDAKGDVLSILAIQIEAEQMNAIMTDIKGMGETGETYLVGEDFLMRSDSRFDEDSTILKRKVNTSVVNKAINNGEHGTGIEISKDYRGKNVLSSYSHLELNEELGTDFEWVIISEIDISEAFAPINALKIRILWIAFLSIIIISLTGYFSAKCIAEPLRNLSDKVALISKGDLTFTVSPGERHDEIGILKTAFCDMLNAFKNQTQQIMEGAGSLATSIAQISVTSTQLATTSSQTSSSVAEITTSAEEIRQITETSSKKAEYVAESARKSSEESFIGEATTNEAINGMKRIKDEMQYIAEGIVKLSEQTLSIGEIINTVNDLSDQSNLLSVNASIEAAKAGEHGKGFAVVAQEVKSLADQSKEATNQVRNILNEIQKATSAAVMTTERGSKAVEAGMDMVNKTGNCVKDLLTNVQRAEESSVQIYTSSKQQLIGMDQLSKGMENIKEASGQNVNSAKQLESACMDLGKLGENLKNITDKFKI